MQFVRATNAAVVFLLFGTLVPAYAQREQQNEKQGKPEKQQGQHQQGSPPAARQEPSHERARQPQAREPQQQKQPQEQGHGQQQQRQPQQPQAREQQQQRQPQEQGRGQQQQRLAQQPQAHEQQQQGRGQPAPQPQQQRAQPADQQRPQQQRAQPAQQQRPQQQQPQRTQKQAVAWQQQRGWIKQGAWREHSTWQQGRAQRWDTDHRTWAQRGGYGGYYIPQATFSLSFGSQHWFRIRSRPVMYMGYPRFSYGGLSFLLVDPWPEYWADNWYANDDVYIDYDDGYYLYNRRYPNVRLAITVAL